MTDQPFSNEEINVATEILRPYAGDHLDVVLARVQDVAVRSGQTLEYTATTVTHLMTKPDDPIVTTLRPKSGRKVIVVAPTYNQAVEYLRAVEARPGTHLIAVEPPMVRGLGVEDTVVVVQGYDPRHRLAAYTDYLRTTQAHVEYVDLDTIMGVRRDH